MTDEEQYEKILAGTLAPGSAVLAGKLTRAQAEIFVTPAAIERMLERFLANDLTAAQLTEWAGFVISHDIYVSPGWSRDEEADRYEPMWHILQQLATPFLDGEITRERIAQHLKTLAQVGTRR